MVVLQQVTSSIKALTDQKLIHRDLALRHVLVFALDVDDVGVTSVKVSDSGLTVNSYTASTSNEGVEACGKDLLVTTIQTRKIGRVMRCIVVILRG